jgi:hypothetical protein
LKSHKYKEIKVAYLTFDPSSEDMEETIVQNIEQIEKALRQRLPLLGVATDDIVFKVWECKTLVSSEEHIEIVLKTDNPKVTSPKVVEILEEVLDVPFEVSRIGVGYGLTEFLHEVIAFIFRHRRNWDSNY